jgi:hypothetical protein
VRFRAPLHCIVVGSSPCGISFTHSFVCGARPRHCQRSALTSCGSLSASSVPRRARDYPAKQTPLLHQVLLSVIALSVCTRPRRSLLTQLQPCVDRFNVVLTCCYHRRLSVSSCTVRRLGWKPAARYGSPFWVLQPHYNISGPRPEKTESVSQHPDT